MRLGPSSLRVFAIAVATLAIGIVAGAQSDDPAGPADLVVLNGRVFAADGRGTAAEAVAIRGNTIRRVGTTGEIESLRGPSTITVAAPPSSPSKRPTNRRRPLASATLMRTSTR